MNGFPWINLTLDPEGPTMRKHQHHTVHDSGFDLLAIILERNLQAFNPLEQTLTRKEDIFWITENAIQIELVNKAYKTSLYKVNDDENIADIAKKFNVNEYAILELNPECTNYEDVKDGQEIIIPSHYGVTMNLYISKKTMLPLLIRVYDHNGLFEEYDYTEFELNPRFAANEFDEHFTEYDF
jgi:outer membrane lipoprotein-sorting protein